MVGTASLAPIWSAPLRVYPAAASSCFLRSLLLNMAELNNRKIHRKGYFRVIRQLGMCSLNFPEMVSGVHKSR